MDYSGIKTTAGAEAPAMTALLRELIALPGGSCQEEGRAKRLLQEMQTLAFDEAVIDAMGNVVGILGTGEKLIVFEGHLDTVDAGPADSWSFDPQEGYEDEEKIGGRGASDQLGGLVAAVYGAKILRDMDLLPEGYKVMIIGTVQKEECDGLSWKYLSQESGIDPRFIVCTEPTDGGIYRGQPGRMEIIVDVKGQDAIMKMANILNDIWALKTNDAAEENEIKGLVKALDPMFNADSVDAHLMGQGDITILDIASPAHAQHVSADSCTITLDRRMTAGDTMQSCLDEIRALPACQACGEDVTVSVGHYDSHAWTGYAYGMDLCFPAWICEEAQPHIQAMVQVHNEMFGETRTGAANVLEARAEMPLMGVWTKAVDGVTLMGTPVAPCVGFGPGSESQVHAVDEITWKQDLIDCAAMYAAVPYCYADIMGDIVHPEPQPEEETMVPVPRKVRFFKRLFGRRNKEKV